MCRNCNKLTILIRSQQNSIHSNKKYAYATTLVITRSYIYIYIYKYIYLFANAFKSSKECILHSVSYYIYIYIYIYKCVCMLWQMHNNAMMCMAIIFYHACAWWSGRSIDCTLIISTQKLTKQHNWCLVLLFPALWPLSSIFQLTKQN